MVAPASAAAARARERGKGNEGIYCGAAIELRDGAIVTGKNSPLMHAASSLVLNAVKHAGRHPRRHPPAVARDHRSPSRTSSSDVLGARSVSLDLEETLIALAISAATNPTAELAMDELKQLSGCEVHMTHIPTPGDEAGLRKLGVNVTTEAVMPTRNLLDA